MKQESTRVLAKGQAISEGNCGVFNSSEKTTIIYSLASKKWWNQKTKTLYYVK